MLPAWRRQGRSPSGYNSANAGWDGSSRKYWTGFKSASRAEISHHTAPDEGVIGRGGDAPPSFLQRYAGRYARRYAWGYRIAIQHPLFALLIAVHNDTYQCDDTARFASTSGGFSVFELLRAPEEDCQHAKSLRLRALMRATHTNALPFGRRLGGVSILTRDTTRDRIH
jgi:hypothetical protein